MNSRNRTKVINIRVNKKEKRRIVRSAAKCKLSISEYLRQLAVGVTPRELPTAQMIGLCRKLESMTSQTKDEALKACAAELREILLQQMMEADDGDDENMARPG